MYWQRLINYIEQGFHLHVHCILLIYSRVARFLTFTGKLWTVHVYPNRDSVSNSCSVLSKCLTECAVNLVCEKHSLKMCWSFQTNSVYMYIFHVGNKNPKGKMTFSSYLVSSEFLWDYRNRSQKNYHYYYHLQFFILKCYSNMKYSCLGVHNNGT